LAASQVLAEFCGAVVRRWTSPRVNKKSSKPRSRVVGLRIIAGLARLREFLLLSHWAAAENDKAARQNPSLGDRPKFQLRWDRFKRQNTFPVADSSKGWRAMTAIEFRRKKMCELEALLEKLDSVKQSTLKPELKDRFTRTCLRQIDRVTAILDDPALARLCSG
jgi:hypothetical protein